MKLARDVYIAGVGETVFGKHKEDFDVLGRQAAFQAIRNSNIDRPDMIQSAYVGNAHNGLVTGQTIFKDLGMLGRVPVINVESACSAGAMAVHLAIKDVACGLTELSIGVGAENHTLHRETGTAFPLCKVFGQVAPSSAAAWRFVSGCSNPSGRKRLRIREEHFVKSGVRAIFPAISCRCPRVRRHPGKTTAREERP